MNENLASNRRTLAITMSKDFGRFLAAAGFELVSVAITDSQSTDIFTVINNELTPQDYLKFLERSIMDIKECVCSQNL
jgi:hypothetical protein